MKLHLSKGDGQNIVNGYDAGHISVNGVRYERPLIIMPSTLISDWSATTLQGLQPEDIAAVLKLQPEVILLGTGRKLQFPRGEIMRVAAEARIGLEVMDTFAACRTYNILMAEGRQVAAALLFE